MARKSQNQLGQKRPVRSLSPTCDERPPCQTHNGTECHGQSLKHLQGQCLHHLLGQSIPVFHHSFSEEIPPKVQPKITMQPYASAVLGRRVCTPQNQTIPSHPVCCFQLLPACSGPCSVTQPQAALCPRCFPGVGVQPGPTHQAPAAAAIPCPVRTLSPCHAVLCNYLRKLESVIFNQRPPPPQDSTEP